MIPKFREEFEIRHCLVEADAAFFLTAWDLDSIQKMNTEHVVFVIPLVFVDNYGSKQSCDTLQMPSIRLKAH